MSDTAAAAAPSAVAPPAVVAVVVTHNPGPWFDEVLAGLAAQDYPGLSVLFIDAASDESPAARIGAVLPNAYVRTLDRNAGFGATANDVIEVVDGAAFYLICHDDVALAPDATRAMVEEAFRSNAGVVGPKLVDWDEPARLLQVGLAADKTGVPFPLVERGELDQEQHDAVRDVFAVPGGCMLVRADLFAALGGFDAAIPFYGEDLDFCWRAHVAGARVLVAPAAVVRHRQALGHRRPEKDRRRLLARHRLRTMLTCYGPWHLLRVLPQAVFIAVVEVLYAAVAGRVASARDVAAAWPWNLRRLPEIRANRARLRAVRGVRDSEVRRLQRRGSARFAAFVRGQIGRGDDRFASLATAGRDLAGTLRAGAPRTAFAVWAAVIAVLVVGSRVLVLDHLPAVGQFAAFPASPLALLREWASGWRSAGLGSESPAPTAFGMAGLLGTVLFAHMGLARLIVTVGLLPVGIAGAWRLLHPAGSLRSRTAVLLVYAAIPLPYNAIARGHWGGLAMWAAAPWILRRLGRASGAAPFGDGAATVTRDWFRHVLLLGLLTALVAALVPFAVAVVLLVGVALVAGSLLAGQGKGSGAMLSTAVGAALVAAVLHVPWTFDFLLPGSEWAAFGGVRTGAAGMTAGQLLRFETGPLGAPPIGWAFLLAAALPLVIGRDWRLAWAVRAWTVALSCWGLAWAGQQSWFPSGLPDADVLLAPAAAGTALAAGLGVLAFEIDLPGYRFGWRQGASVIAAVAAVVGLVPVAGAAVNGRWQAPRGDLRAALAFLDEENPAAQFRVLWLGDPEALPVAGWKLDDGLAYATTDRGTPRLQDQWAGSSEGPTRLLGDAMQIALRQQTTRLGRLLAPMGVRYIVIPQATAPVPFTATRRPAPPALFAALAEQLDLERVEVNPALRVYRNVAWAPIRSELAVPGADRAEGGFFITASGADLRASTAVLPDASGHAHYEGELEAGADVYLSASASDGWRLEAGGSAAHRYRAFGWANGFVVDEGGPATLRYSTPVLRYLMLGVQVLLWLAAARWLWLGRRRRREADRRAAQETV